MNHYQVHFQPDDFRVSVTPGQSILEAANEAGIILNAICGGAGTCNKCLVRISGESEPVRACQYRVDRDLEVRIPDSSRFFEQQILQTGFSRSQAQAAPGVDKYCLQLAKPNLDDLRSDADRLFDALAQQSESLANDAADEQAKCPATIELMPLRQLPTLLRHHDYTITVVSYDSRIEFIEGGDTSRQLYGIAIDLGTTTVVGHLVELYSGHVLAGASRTNPQITYGDDVVSRIEYTVSRSEGLGRLQQCAVECINEIIDELCISQDIPSNLIYEVTLAGNTTMQHIIAGVPVAQIAQAPYVGGFSHGMNLDAAALGLAIHPQGRLYLLPGVAAHVGGDAVAVALATGMGHQTNKICLAIDIGTNGEILLSCNGTISACSTAAGPAFEGSRISQGMRASCGAIEGVHIDSDEIDLHVIGDCKPTGICGSGLIDAIGELLKAGVLDPSGRILSGNELPVDMGPEIRRRVIEDQNGKAFILAESGSGAMVRLTQRDIRETQLGKASIAAGAAMLMKSQGVEVSDLDRIYLAGAFGNYIRPESACRIGLLPNVDLGRVRFVGNAAGAGAIEVLRSRHVRRYNEALARSIGYVELAGRSDFMDLYSHMMMFPDVKVS